MLRNVLLVEPDQDLAALLHDSVPGVADLQWHFQFETARIQLLRTPFEFLVTNLRLSSYNGLHLVHLAAAAGMPTRAIVYTDRHEPLFAREIQRAGAFYETRECLPHAIAAYLRGALPPSDRRNPAARDRRKTFRGGRRCWDRPFLHGLA